MATSLPTSNGVLTGPQPLDAANDILRADASNAGATIHSFDPDASPEEKAAAAGKARSALKSKTAETEESGREVTIDPGASNIVPTITIEDVDKLALVEHTTNEHPQPPGAMPTGSAPPIPDWYKVGWRAFVDQQDEDQDAKEVRMMHSFISEQYYGDWYHNAALVTFAVIASHFVTRFNFGWGWLFIVLAVCNTYYTTSMARVRRRARDDIQRELVKTALTSEHESAEWINEFLERFWLIYEPVLSATIVSSVDQILSTNCPTFLESLRLSSFTLGNKAPRIDKVRTFPRTAEDIVMMDWGISFTPNDVSDLTPREQAKKRNPKIVLAIRVGKGVAAATIPVLAEDMTFSGLMRVRMKLMNNFPHVQLVDISFMEKPIIDYVLKPIGGDTFGFDIANIPGLSSFIRDLVHSILGPMMYDPHFFTLNLEQLLSGTPLDTAIGVVKITIRSARGIKGSKIGGGTPDPYVALSINNRGELAKTKWKRNSANPSWHETKFLLVNNLAENINLTVLDYNEHRKDSELGAALFELNKLQEDSSQDGVEAPIFKDGKEKGLLRFDVSYFPVLQPEIDESGVEELPESKVGIVRFVIHQGKDLDTTKVHSNDINPFAKIFVGNQSQPIANSIKAKHTVQPVWECATEFLCSDRSSSVITVKVIDDRDFLKDPVIGYLSVSLDDLLESGKEAGRDWWPLSGCKSGRVRLSAEWKPLDMAGSLHGADQYSPPIGVIRLWLKKATDVKNVEATLGGKSDPYVRVMLKGTVTARTEVVNNNLNPEWDQIIYAPVHDLKERLLLEVMDYQHLTKDRSLGTVDLYVGGLAKEAPAGGDPLFRFESTGKQEFNQPICLDHGKTFKGQLHYVAEFIPAYALQGIGFESGPNELQGNTSGGSDEGHAVPDSASSMSSSSEEVQTVPVGITAKRPIDERGHRSTKSTDTTATTATAQSQRTAESQRSGARPTSPRNAKTDTAEGKEEQGIRMPKEELIQHQSGIIVFHVKSGELSKKARLEVLLDDGYWPSLSTVRSSSTRANWEHVGEGFIKELDFGRVWLRLNEADVGDKDDILGEWKGDAKAFLEQTLSGSSRFTLLDEDEKVTGTVDIEARYVPVPVVLEPRESVNNQGLLRVSLVDGKGIHGADRSGKSDPFAVFTLNGTKVFKSQTKKKTLNPSWNEDFIVSVPSRVGSDFTIELFDWNQIDKAKSLGSAKINLEDLEPFHGVDRVVALSSAKHGDKGEVRISLVFQPEIIAKSRKNTSTFSTAGRAMTQLGSAPINVGKGVFHGVTGVFKRGNHTDSEEDSPTTGQGHVPSPPGGQMSQPVGAADRMGAPGVAASPHNGRMTLPPEPGTLRVTVVDAKDIYSGPDSVKPYVELRVGNKEFRTKHVGKTVAPEWNETFEFSASAQTPKIYAWIYDHHTIGKDKLLGEAEVDIWRHIQPIEQSSADVFVEVREGQGILKLRLSFDSDPLPSSRKSTSSGGDRSVFSSPSRFSIRSRRPGSGDDKDDE
ncbi:tricalbin [Amylostereum chailletii]|nr:tricalbin [Amylostereum chailletii]